MSSTNAAESVKVSVKPVVLVDLDFVSGHVRAHDGDGSIEFGGNTYTGVGTFGSIEAVDEDSEIIAKPLKLTLSGVDPSMIEIATAGDYQGRVATVYFGFCRENSNTLVDDPEIAWEGYMDTMAVRLDKESSIELNCEHRLRREPRIARYTSADQQLAYPDDLFFDLVPKIPGYVGQWGVQIIIPKERNWTPSRRP